MAVPPTPDSALEARIAADPRYVSLVRDRQRFSWLLTAITIIAYGSFLCLIAFNKPFMARPIGSGTISVAVVLGAALLMGIVAITIVYVVRANSDYDRRLARLLSDLAE